MQQAGEDPSIKDLFCKAGLPTHTDAEMALWEMQYQVLAPDAMLPTAPFQLVSM